MPPLLSSAAAWAFSFLILKENGQQRAKWPMKVSSVFRLHQLVLSDTGGPGTAQPTSQGCPPLLYPAQSGPCQECRPVCLSETPGLQSHETGCLGSVKPLVLWEVIRAATANSQGRGTCAGHAPAFLDFSPPCEISRQRVGGPSQEGQWPLTVAPSRVV